MRIPLSHLDGRVPHQFLYRVEVHAGHHQLTSEGVPEIMKAEVLQARHRSQAGPRVLDVVKRLASLVVREHQRSTGLHRPIFQQSQCIGIEVDVACLSGLGIDTDDGHRISLEVDFRPSEGEYLTASHPGI